MFVITLQGLTFFAKGVVNFWNTMSCSLTADEPTLVSFQSSNVKKCSTKLINLASVVKQLLLFVFLLLVLNFFLFLVLLFLKRTVSAVFAWLFLSYLLLYCIFICTYFGELNNEVRIEHDMYVITIVILPGLETAGLLSAVDYASLNK